MTAEITLQGAPSWREVAEGWTRGRFVDDLTAHIVAGDAPAIAWECVPASRDTADQPFRCVVLPRPELDRVPADPHTFAGQLGGAAVACFDNLGGDARLVVPGPDPTAGPGGYPHLRAFLTRAPAPRIRGLWAAVGRGVLDWWVEGPEPVWVSTAGGGVAWLHVRLDRRPKYYRHVPYRE